MVAFLVSITAYSSFQEGITQINKLNFALVIKRALKMRIQSASKKDTTTFSQ
jgi:hypothetical protein